MRILVVEDEADQRAETVDYLRRRRHEVVACATAEAARTVLAEATAGGRPLKLVLCDAGLPDGDGVDLYLSFAGRLPGCRWLLMSGNHDMDRLEGRLAGMAGPKPMISEKPVPMRLLLRLLE